jgi:ribose transport system substrate-binding protein
MKKKTVVISVLMLVAIVLGACAPAAPAPEPPAVEQPAVEAPVVEEPQNPGLQMEAAKVAPQFFTIEGFNESLELMEADPINPEQPIYLQSLIDNKLDTSEFQKDPPYNICFSNAGVNNPWRVTGYVTMREQVEDLRAEGLINNFIHVDADGNDAKQIADIEDLLATPGKCDLLIVSPNTSEALTPIVEQACEQLPVIVFDRGVRTDCPTSFIKTIGGYAFGIAGAQFIVDNLPDGGNVIAFRILPGVDVLEERWGAAREIFAAGGNFNVVGVEFHDYDAVKTNTIIRDYLDRFGRIDAVWMDAGGVAVAALEAFEDAGQPYPVIVGEDQSDFLEFIAARPEIRGVAPTFPTFQWRTAVLAAVMILQGEEVDQRWVLPQPIITSDNVNDFLVPGMPPLYYVLSGAETLSNWPDAWIALDTGKYVDVLD